MLIYAKSVVWDFLLCVIASVALCYTACSGFYSTQPFQTLEGLALMTAVCVVLNASMFAVTWSARTTIYGSVLLGIVLAGIVGASIVTSGAGESALDDVAGNNLYLTLCLIVPTVFVFVLSRRKTPALVLVVVGTLFCAIVEYLYWYGHVLSLIAFLVGSVGLFVYRGYQASLLKSESEHLAFASITVAGVALALASVVLAGGLYVLVVAPLNPPNLVLKLITEHYKTDEIEVRGVGATLNVQDDSLLSNNASDEIVNTGNSDNKDVNRQNDDESGRGQASIQEVSGSAVNTDIADSDDGGGSMSLRFPNWLPLVIACVLLVLIIGAILLKRYLRYRRYRHMLEGGDEHAVRTLYLFFLERFRKLKMPALESATLREYAASIAGHLAEFEQASGDPAFSGLTDIYAGSVYGDAAVGDAQRACFEDYYRRFYKRAVRYVGRIRYCRLYFFI